jgi:hypothetical protein
VPARVQLDSSLALKDLDQDHRFFVQTTSSDLVKRLGWGKEKDQDPSDVVRHRRGPAYRHDPALVDRGHLSQVEGDRSTGSEAGDRLEQPIGVLGQHRTDESQRAASQQFDLHPAIVGRSATPGKARIQRSVASRMLPYRGRSILPQGGFRVPALCRGAERGP